MKLNRVKPAALEPLCYMVASDSEEDAPHRVELETNDGWGQCSCGDWTYRRNPDRRERNHDRPKHGQCKHLVAARVYHSLMLTINSQKKIEKNT